VLCGLQPHRHDHSFAEPRLNPTFRVKKIQIGAIFAAMRESFADKKKRAHAIYRILSKTYPDVKCELDFKNPLQLLVATVLSAQCTDKRVNAVTPALFKKYKNVRAFAGADIRELQTLIKSTGFFRAKAKSIKGLATVIVTEYNGKVPQTLEDLITLPGVGRKTANVVLGHAFDTPGLTVDTHFGRLVRRFGWTKETDPVRVEFAIMELIPRKEWTNLSQRLIWHGRRVCHSRKPACAACPLTKLCPSFGIGEMDLTKARAMVKSDKDFR
jgi:endonuclease III